MTHQHMNIFHHPNTPSTLNTGRMAMEVCNSQITNTLTTSQVPELDTYCELIWPKFPTGNKTTYLGVYYRPPSDKGKSLEYLSTSLNTICNSSSANFMLTGDFNLGNRHTTRSQSHTGSRTRNDRTLDLLCMSNTFLVNRVETLPPLGYHAIIFSEINLSLSKAKQLPHKVFIYKTADWEKFGKNVKETYTHIEEHQLELDIDNMWNYFKTKTTQSIHNEYQLS
ncbi:unnamed protein product [Mytilus coruscus]|uniref:Endonuclease/exonuclease/phosphatase domain-containing protein n=1 Tax=Mytilus coruscus TaxID=42192 RepID=A0A6J8EBG4_MYTCO|nr:unnamed protein product [Mytilus coruscus]